MFRNVPAVEIITISQERVLSRYVKINVICMIKWDVISEFLGYCLSLSFSCKDVSSSILQRRRCCLRVSHKEHVFRRGHELERHVYNNYIDMCFFSQVYSRFSRAYSWNCLLREKKHEKKREISFSLRNRARARFWNLISLSPPPSSFGAHILYTEKNLINTLVNHHPRVEKQTPHKETPTFALR